MSLLKEYLKQIVFTIHFLIFIMCLLFLSSHNEGITKLGFAVLVLNYLGVIVSFIYFYLGNIYKIFSGCVICLIVSIFIPQSVYYGSKRKCIKDCPVYIKVVLDTVISHPARRISNKRSSTPYDEVHSHYFVNGKLYYVSFTSSYNQCFDTGDTIKIVYSCDYPNVYGILQYGNEDKPDNYRLEDHIE